MARPLSIEFFYLVYWRPYSWHQLRNSEFVEIAPGIRLKEDVTDHIGFMPIISNELKEMDNLLFLPETMGIQKEWPAELKK